MSAASSGAPFTGKITDETFESVFSKDPLYLGSNLERYMTDMIRSAYGDEAVTADVLSTRLTTAENGGAREVEPYKTIQSVLDFILTGEVPPGATPIADIPSNYDEIYKFSKGVNEKYKSETLQLTLSEMLSVTTAWLALGIATPDQVKSRDCIWTLKVHRAFCLLLRKHQWRRAEAARRGELDAYRCGESNLVVNGAYLCDCAAYTGRGNASCDTYSMVPPLYDTICHERIAIHHLTNIVSCHSGCCFSDHPLNAYISSRWRRWDPMINCC
jgi:hypothetical protein